MNLQTIIFIGRSGAGKGTQAKLLNVALTTKDPARSVLYIETGDYFRKYITEPGYTWDRARVFNEAGKRQPEFLAIWMWAGALISTMDENKHIVVDGMPRSRPEAKILHNALAFYERPQPTVIFLNVSRQWAEDRLAGRGRADDMKPEVVARRLAWYDEDVLPAIEYYRTNLAYRFVEVNGEQTPEQVTQDIFKALDLS